MIERKGKGLGVVLLAYLLLSTATVGGYAGTVLAANPSMDILRMAADMIDSSGLADSLDGGTEQLAQLKTILTLTDTANASTPYLTALAAASGAVLIIGMILAIFRLTAAGIDDLGAPPLLLAVTGPLGMARIEQVARGAALAGPTTWRDGRVWPLATLLAMELPVVGLLGLSILQGTLGRLPEKGLLDPAPVLEAYVTSTLLLNGAMIVAAYLIAYAGWHWLWTVHKALRKVAG